MTQRVEGNTLSTSGSIVSSTTSDHKSLVASSNHDDSLKLNSNLITTNELHHVNHRPHQHSNNHNRNGVNSNNNNNVNSNKITNGNNIGHSGHSHASSFVSSVNVTGGPLSYTYTLDSIHLHFGTNDSKGSEHTIEGIAFPGEVS